MGWFKFALISIIAVSVVAVGVGVTVWSMDNMEEETRNVEQHQQQNLEFEDMPPQLKRTILRNNFHNLDDPTELDKVETEGVTMEAENGAPHFFAIEENLSTGYSWIIDYEECDSVLIVDEDYDAPEEIEDLVGAPGKKQLKISGKSAGTCTSKWHMLNSGSSNGIT